MPGPRLVFPFSETPPRAHDIWVSKPQARRGARWPDAPPGRARPGAARSGLRAPRWPACFARPRRHAEAALWLRGRGQGSAALSGSLPDGASSPAPARSLANLPDPGAARRGAARRQRGLPGGASGPRQDLGASAGPRGLVTTPRAATPRRCPPAGLTGACPAAPPPPRRADGRANTALQRPACRTAHAKAVRTASAHPALGSNTRGVGLSRRFSDLSVQPHTFLRSSSDPSCWPGLHSEFAVLRCSRVNSAACWPLVQNHQLRSLTSTQ